MTVDFYRSAAAAAGLGAFEWDLASDTCRWENQQAITGVEPDHPPQSRRQFFETHLHLEDAPAFERALASIAEAAPFRIAVRIRRPAESTWRWAEFTGRLLPAESGATRRLAGIVADATERRRAADAESFFRHSAAILALVSARDAAWTRVNPVWEQTFGWREAEIRGTAVADLLHPEDRPRFARDAAALASGRALNGIEHRLRCKDGGYRWIDWSIARDPERDLLVCTGRDITERLGLDAALAWSEARLRALISGIPQLVWRADEHGNWLWSSPQWTAYTGLSAEASRGRGWLRAVHPEDSHTVSAAWAEAAQRESLDMECRLFDPPGARYRWFQNRATPVRDRNGRIVEWLGTFTDIDELLRMRDRQSSLVGELQHRTRNLLGVVRSAAQRTMQSAGSLQEFGARFDRRLAALSRVQGLLSRSDDEAITIGRLVRMELEVAGAWAHRDRVEIDGPEVRLRNTTVQTLALAIHELAANAKQHGALAGEAGELVVRWRIARRSGERRLVLDWAERGINGAADGAEATHRGLGRQLVERALPYSLGAETRFELSAHALRCKIELPMRMRGEQEVAG